MGRLQFDRLHNVLLESQLLYYLCLAIYSYFPLVISDSEAPNFTVTNASPGDLIAFVTSIYCLGSTSSPVAIVDSNHMVSFPQGYFTRGSLYYMCIAPPNSTIDSDFMNIIVHNPAVNYEMPQLTVVGLNGTVTQSY